MSRSVRLLVVLLIAAIGLVVPASIATAASPPAITTTSLPDGIQGIKYPTTTLKVKGGSWPYKWSIVSGTLPYGLKLSSGGQLSGATAYIWSNPNVIEVQVKDAKGVTATRQLSFNIKAFEITTPTLPKAKKGQLYYAKPKINGGCLTYPAEGVYYQRLRWRVATTPTYPGTLPQGLKIADNGVISGAPKAAGTYTFLVVAECEYFMNGAAGKAFTLVVS